MAEGEIGAVFRALARDAEEAGGRIADSMAKVSEDTANIAEANLARTLEADAKAAKELEAIAKKEADEAAAAGATVPPGTAVPGMDQPGDLVADKIAMHAGHRSVPGVADEDMAEYLERIMSTPGYPLRSTPSGVPRMAWWDEETGTMIIRNGNDGTFMQPTRGRAFFDEEVQGKNEPS